jgi:lipid-A-disaccharide synthase
MPNILVVAGEASGDLHGGRLVQALKTLAPDCNLFGIGGEHMARAGMELLFHIRDMAVVGFTEVIRRLPFLRRAMRTLEHEVEKRKPRAAILIDYPGFNLRLAKRLRRRGVKTLFYIAPQVWAWGASRIPKMAAVLDEMAVVFPFEVELFAQAGLATTFVGHPLLEGLTPRLSRKDFFQRFAFAEERPLLGLLPGSRTHEIERLLPDMIATARLLQTRLPHLQIGVAQAPALPRELYERHLITRKNVRATAWPWHQKNSRAHSEPEPKNLGSTEVGTFTNHGEAINDEIKLIDNATYELMRESTACLVCSGTATLETACLGTPLVIVYRISKLSYEIGKRLVKLPHIGLVNVVAGRKIAPELVQNDFTPEAAAEALRPYLQDRIARERASQELIAVREQLGTPGASVRTAEIALRLAGEFSL